MSKFFNYIIFLDLEADDNVEYDLSVYFNDCIDFIHKHR